MSLAMSRQLHGIGTPFIAGTDSGSGYRYEIPGFALHAELVYFLKAGSSPLEALQTATLNAARATRREAQFGTVTMGKRADLPLVGGDPLASLAALEQI